MSADNSHLDHLYKPDRFVEVAKLHKMALTWEPQGRIPLGIHVANPEYATGLDYSEWLNPEPYLEFQAKMLADTLTVGSDLMPAVAINHLGDVVIPSMFGARLLMPHSGSETYQEAGAMLQDVGPTPYPVLSDIQEVADLKTPPLDAGIVPEIEKIIRFYRENLPPWVHVVAPMPIGPFSTAMELRGSEILIDLVDHPDLCHRLLAMCGHLQVAVDQRLRRPAGTPLDRFVTNFSIHTVGLRLGDDSIVNLSPAMIHQFCLPTYATVNQDYSGRGHIHFCSLAHSRFEHIYEALAPAPEVIVASSQFAFEYYEQHVDELRGRLAIESFYGDAYRYVCQKYGSFRDWANEFVPRFKNESGLVLYFQVDSLEEGHEVWAAWQEAHQK